MSVLEMERVPGYPVPLELEVMDGPETRPGMVFEVMSEGYAAETNPTPLALITTNTAASTEAVLAKMSELSNRIEGGLDPETGERFKPLTLTDLQAEIESIEVSNTPVTDHSVVGGLFEPDNLVRPRAEAEEEEPETGIEDTEPKSTWGKDLLLGLRRSRLGRTVAATALVAGGALTWVSSASAGGLKDTCATDIFKQPTVVPGTGLYHAGKKRQSFDIQLGFDAVDPTCNGHFERLPYFKPELIRHGHTINESPRWIPLFTPGFNPNVAGNFGLTYSRSLTDPKYKYWRPGDKVQFELSLREFNVAAKKVVGNTVTTYRIPVVTRTP